MIWSWTNKIRAGRSHAQLPHGYIIRSLISSNGPYWTVSTYTDAKIFHDQATGQDSVNLRNGPLFQFNSFDGSLVRRINMPPKLNARIVCEHNGAFTALTADKQTGRQELLTGSVAR